MHLLVWIINCTWSMVHTSKYWELNFSTQDITFSWLFTLLKYKKFVLDSHSSCIQVISLLTVYKKQLASTARTVHWYPGRSTTNSQLLQNVEIIQSACICATFQGLFITGGNKYINFQQCVCITCSPISQQHYSPLRHVSIHNIPMRENIHKNHQINSLVTSLF